MPDKINQSKVWIQLKVILFRKIYVKKLGQQKIHSTTDQTILKKSPKFQYFPDNHSHRDLTTSYWTMYKGRKCLSSSLYVWCIYLARVSATKKRSWLEFTKQLNDLIEFLSHFFHSNSLSLSLASRSTISNKYNP